MLTDKDHRERYRSYQDIFRNRSRNLRHLIEAAGSWHHASRITGKSIQLLKQVAGENACRTIGDRLAQEFEHAFKLSEGRLGAPWS
jgi:hypothetical protein